MVQAVGLSAHLAMEVTVQLLNAAGMVVVTQTILRGTAAVLDDMEQVVLGKERQRSKDRGFVERIGRRFEIGKAERIPEARHGFKHQNPDCRRTYSVPHEHLFTRMVAHGLWGN